MRRWASSRSPQVDDTGAMRGNSLELVPVAAPALPLAFHLETCKCYKDGAVAIGAHHLQRGHALEHFGARMAEAVAVAHRRDRDLRIHRGQELHARRTSAAVMPQ